MYIYIYICVCVCEARGRPPILVPGNRLALKPACPGHRLGHHQGQGRGQALAGHLPGHWWGQKQSSGCGSTAYSSRCGRPGGSASRSTGSHLAYPADRRADTQVRSTAEGGQPGSQQGATSPTLRTAKRTTIASGRRSVNRGPPRLPCGRTGGLQHRWTSSGGGGPANETFSVHRRMLVTMHQSSLLQ